MTKTAASLEQMLVSLKSLATEGLVDGSGPEQVPKPVDSWNPTHCGDIGLEILKDGVWRHEGTRITREALIRLFSTILRKDADGETYLVTPVEKVKVRVEDAPFLAIRVDRDGSGRDQTLVFTTNVGDVVAADADHRIRVSFDRVTGEPRPYVLVRGRLEARILRAPFLELADWTVEHEGRQGLWSRGVFFPIDAQP